MKKFRIFLIVFLFSLSGSFAQSIYVSESVTEDGEAIGANNTWNIDAWGKSLFIVYDNGKPITNNILYLFIDKFVSGSFQPFESKVVEIEEKANFIKYDHKFMETGKFKVYVVNEDQETLSSMLLTLKTDTRGETKAAESENYYDGIGLIFSEYILVGGTPLGIVKSISLSKSNGWVYMKISHYAPLNSSILQVDFWGKEGNAFDFDQYIETKKYKIDPTWHDTYFRYQFTRPGRFKIVFYNEFEAIIKTGYITVTR